MTMETVDSTRFMKKPPVTAFTEQKISTAREVLLNRIFLGCYEERRYVVELREYRDVVTISSAETELVADLDIIKKSVTGIYGMKWVGINGPEAECFKPGHCLWVKLKNIPFGCYWFQIRQIKFENDEFILRLKSLRPVRPADYGYAPKNNIPKPRDSNNSFEEPAEYSFDFDPTMKIPTFYAVLNDWVQQVRHHLTWNNFFVASKFILSIIFVIISSMLTSIQYLGDYSLRLLRELTLLLHVLMPFFIQAVDCLTKTIGGLFILITLMFRGCGPRNFQRQFQSQQNAVSNSRQDLQQLMPAPTVHEFFSRENCGIYHNNWIERK